MRRQTQHALGLIQVQATELVVRRHATERRAASSQQPAASSDAVWLGS
jgi:hypothetical protein